MSMYYLLDTTNYIGKEEDLENIMSAFQESLRKLTGLKLCDYYGEPLQQFNNLSDIQILHEDVLWKDLTFDEKLGTFKKYLNDIDGLNNKLTIIDPYLFPNNYDTEYKNLITEILKLNSSELTLITNRNNFNRTLYDDIKSNLNINVELKFCSDFHDRLWINTDSKKGFILGSSLNGVGKKICFINPLNDDDCQSTIDYINNTLQNHN